MTLDITFEKKIGFENTVEEINVKNILYTNIGKENYIYFQTSYQLIILHLVQSIFDIVLVLAFAKICTHDCVFAEFRNNSNYGI